MNTFPVVFISAACHLIFFSAFTFSFNPKVVPLESPGIHFFGRVLPDFPQDFQLMDGNPLFLPCGKKRISLIHSLGNLAENTCLVDRQGFLTPLLPLKPAASAGAGLFTRKETFVPPLFSADDALFPKTLEPPIVFHPSLPGSFSLYFRDRRSVHVELMFKKDAGPQGLKNYIVVKRKISSGNLEADLLITRYLKHYFFIRRQDFSGRDWQTVKIDLSL